MLSLVRLNYLKNLVDLAAYLHLNHLLLLLLSSRVLVRPNTNVDTEGPLFAVATSGTDCRLLNFGLKIDAWRFLSIKIKIYRFNSTFGPRTRFHLLVVFSLNQVIGIAQN